MSAPAITSVIFDIGNVLYRWDLSLIYRDVFADPVERDWFTATVITPGFHFRHDRGESLDALVVERSAEYPEYATQIALYRANGLASVPGPVPGSLELVERLAARGVPLFGITNFGAETWDMFRPTAPIFDHFRDIIVSGREKLVKPDPAIYRLALDRFGVAAEASLFIDDRDENIAAAQRLGIRGHLFRDAETLEAELCGLGLL